MESPVSTPAVLPLHLLVPVVSNAYLVPLWADHGSYSDPLGPTHVMWLWPQSLSAWALRTWDKCQPRRASCGRKPKTVSTACGFPVPFSTCFCQQGLIVVNNTKYLLEVSYDHQFAGDAYLQRITANFCKIAWLLEIAIFFKLIVSLHGHSAVLAVVLKQSFDRCWPYTSNCICTILLSFYMGEFEYTWTLQVRLEEKK